MAQWFIATAKTAHDLKQAREIINWVVAHQIPGGLLSEQLDPNTGAPLSVSPLTWSHAEFIATVDEFCRKSERLRRVSISNVGPQTAKPQVPILGLFPPPRHCVPTYQTLF